ncbi:hypothetical protein [Parvularcula maris]|uniref:Cytochrome c domain-containing protein n=1 Tax=Parvularcula maris TaxID=2965077 RepID=A0A9X2LAU1_9PROT|nr:hypothetical protein [Parvularcula maris]MCQ8186293.1 hypothetical protein [Parvularcula maris]
MVAGHLLRWLLLAWLVAAPAFAATHDLSHSDEKASATTECVLCHLAGDESLEGSETVLAEALVLFEREVEAALKTHEPAPLFRRSIRGPPSVV